MVLRRPLIVILIALLLPATVFAANRYTVKKGDNLYDLSKKFGVSVEDLKSTNGLNSDRLDIGDEIIIPSSNNTNNKVSGKTNESNNNAYVVSKGDTLSEIAEKHSVSTKDLINANKLNNNKLQIGQKLLIPGRNQPAPAFSETDVVIETASNAASDNLKPAEPEAKSSSHPREYTVQSGDTLGHIAVKFNTTSRVIRSANGLKTDRLQIGQILKIPSPYQDSDTVQSIGRTSEANNKNDKGIYIVERGDTPSGIARKLGVRTDELIKLNSLDSRHLRIGQKLNVPGYEAEATKPESVQASSEPAESGADGPVPAKKAETKSAVHAQYYTVVKGDTPSGIAEKLGVRTNDLIELNNIDSRSLQIGQKLSIPGAQSVGDTSGNVQAESVDAGAVNRESKDESAETATPSTLPADYIVQKGDNLYDISRKFGITVNYIKTKNNLKNNSLRIGQKLVLNTEGTTEPARAQAEESGTAVQSSKYTEKYTVRKGDTIGHLAVRFGVSQSELKSVNGLTNDNLKIGQVLLVPETKKTEIIVLRESAPEAVSEIYIKKRYTVKAGDSLSGIASSYGVTVDEIKKASALKNDTINTGDILLIPVPQEKVTASINTAYTVAAGDTLGTIGSRFGVSVRELKDVNGLTSDRIRVGMKLNVPGAHSSGLPNTATNRVVATPSPSGKYVVKRGDTLGKIARRHGVSLTELKRENNVKGNMIRVGQVLTIPGYTAQEPAYIAVGDNSIANSNGHNTYTEAEVKNGRFSKESIIQVAKKYLGAPYKFGGYDFTTGIDCSGYVKKIFSRFNVQLPRTARDIYYKSGNKVNKSQLDSGDLVFFQTYAKYPSHVGIYIGNDEFIHASSASKMVTIDSINKRYYRKRYIGAKRVQLSGLFYDEYSKGYRGFDN